MLRVAASLQEDNSMINDSALDLDVHDINPVALERAAECAFEGERIDVVDIQIKSRVVNHTVIFLKTRGNPQHQS